MDRPRFVIQAPEVQALLAAANLAGAANLLPSLVKAAQSLARPPISKFPVGTVGFGSVSGRIFVGVNVEFPGVPLHHSIHAEQFLVANLALHSEPVLQSLAVSAAPCGHCRQFLQELRRAPELQILIADDRSGDPIQFEPLLNLLPRPFGPHDLLERDMPLVLEPHDNGLIFANGGGVGDLAKAALEAANAAHAPYSACPSGIAIADRKGRIFKGSYVESAAYNPSLGPVQAAIVAYIVGRNGEGERDGYGDIVGAVLVEKEGAVISQAETARLLLRTISPECEFAVIRCVSAKKKDCC